MIRIHLSDYETSLVNQYASLSTQIKEMEAEKDQIRKQLEDLILANEVPLDETIKLQTSNTLLDFGKSSEKLKFNYSIQDFINETKLYSAIKVGTTECRKALSNQQLEKYFIIENGSRTCKVTIL